MRAITTPREEPTAPASRSCRTILANGDRPSNSSSGPFPFGKDLAQLSDADFARAAERRTDAFCRPGIRFPARRARLGIAVQLSTPATCDRRSPYRLRGDPQGQDRRACRDCHGIDQCAHVRPHPFHAATAAARPRRFPPALARQLRSHRAEFAGNPLGLDSDDVVFEKSSDTHTAAIFGNVSGASLCLIEVGGSFGRELASQGEGAMVNFAGDWLPAFMAPNSRKCLDVATPRGGTDHEPLFLGEPPRPQCRAARARRRSMPSRFATRSGSPAKPFTRPCGAPVGGAWESASAPPKPSCCRLGPAKDAGRRKRPARPTQAAATAI